MNRTLITTLIALTSSIDPKVKLEFHAPQAGSNQWPSVGFNPYCYEKNTDRTKTETRTRAMLDLMGQASRVLVKDDPEGSFSMRTFYRDGQGALHPQLAISIAPTSNAQTTPTRDIGAELASACEKAAALGVDLSTIPAVVAAQPGSMLGFVNGLIARAQTKVVNEEVAATGAPADEAPPL